MTLVRARTISWLCCLALTSGACTDDDARLNVQLGARCQAPNDCASRCLATSEAYPGGMCTLGCTADADCPRGSACSGLDDGVCLFVCRDDSDCKFLGVDEERPWLCVTVPGAEDDPAAFGACRGVAP